MLSLTTIEPHGCSGVYHHGVSRGGSGGSSDGHEAGVDAGEVGVHGDGLAGSVEGGLRDGVVVGGELELDHVADGGFDVVGVVGKGSIAGADLDDVDCDCSIGS